MERPDGLRAWLDAVVQRRVGPARVAWLEVDEGVRPFVVVAPGSPAMPLTDAEWRWVTDDLRQEIHVVTSIGAWSPPPHPMLLGALWAMETQIPDGIFEILEGKGRFALYRSYRLVEGPARTAAELSIAEVDLPEASPGTLVGHEVYVPHDAAIDGLARSVVDLPVPTSAIPYLRLRTARAAHPWRPWLDASPLRDLEFHQAVCDAFRGHEGAGTPLAARAESWSRANAADHYAHNGSFGAQFTEWKWLANEPGNLDVLLRDLRTFGLHRFADVLEPVGRRWQSTGEVGDPPLTRDASLDACAAFRADPGLLEGLEPESWPRIAVDEPPPDLPLPCFLQWLHDVGSHGKATDGKIAFLAIRREVRTVLRAMLRQGVTEIDALSLQDAIVDDEITGLLEPLRIRSLTMTDVELRAPAAFWSWSSRCGVDSLTWSGPGLGIGGLATLGASLERLMVKQSPVDPTDLVACARLRELSLPSVEPGLVATVGRLSELRYLFLGEVGDAGIAALAEHPNLEHLRLEGSVTSAIVPVLSTLGSLRELTLSDLELTPIELAALASLPRLEQILVGHRRITAEELSSYRTPG